jgi:nicotinamide mononucleotide transporter
MKIQTNWVKRLLGDKPAHKEHIFVVISMLVVTALYEYAATMIIPEFRVNWYEFVGTWAGLTCVWLTRTQNVLCWPWGIVSSIAFGFFFMEIGLPGQQWLNWGYFLIVQLWAWPYWVFGGENLTKLSVTRLRTAGKLLAVAAVIIGTVVIYQLIGYFAPGSLYPILDALVVASSVTAQYLLGRKVIESWWLWLGPVNLISIALFFASGAYVVTALYFAFFIHAAFALRDWYREEDVNKKYV